MDPMSIAAVVSSLLGLASQSQSQQSQQNLSYQNLNETKRSNRERERLATSDQRDAYGNRIYYDPSLGWQIELTPQTKSILDAEQSETLSSLTTDAARNRNAAERMDKRSASADEEFEDVFNEFKYRPRRSESEYIGDATNERLRARRKGADEAAANVNKTLIRTGNSSAIPSVFREARDAEAQEFEDILVGGKRQGRQDYLNFEGAAESKGMQEMNFLRAIADGTTTSPQRFTNTNEQLSGNADQAMRTLLQTLGQSDANTQNAMSGVISAAGQYPDFSSLASALGKLGGSMGEEDMRGSIQDTPYIPYPRPREEMIRARERYGYL